MDNLRKAQYVIRGMILCLICLVCLIGLIIIPLWQTSAETTYIPTKRQLQEALCEAGYPVEVDCVIGRETLRQWSRYCADREAAKYFTPSGGLEKK